MNDALNSALGIIPEKFRPWFLLLSIWGPYLTRACHAFASGRGLVGSISAVLFGTNTPAAGAPVKIQTTLNVLLLGLTVGVSGLVIAGCASPPQRVAFNTVSVPVTTADQAMTIWGDYVKQFHPPAATERKVLAAYRKVKAAELAAIDSAHAAANAMGSTNLTASVTTQLQSPEVSQALSELLELMRSIGVKI